MVAGSMRKAAFEDIYRTHRWGGASRSGPGSDAEHTASYIRFVNHWLHDHPDCRSIVELGCGDWATARLLNLTPRHSYLGLDIVQEVVAENRKRYQSQTVRFECSDFLSELPPDGDVLLIKDVLQHLSNANVMHFVDRVLPRFRYAIITNDVRKYEKRRRFGVFTVRKELQAPNIDIRDGESRPLRLDCEPFNVKALQKSSYSVVLRDKDRRVVFVKEILIWRNRL